MNSIEFHQTAQLIDERATIEITPAENGAKKYKAVLSLDCPIQIDDFIKNIRGLINYYSVVITIETHGT